MFIASRIFRCSCSVYSLWFMALIFNILQGYISLHSQFMELCEIIDLNVIFSKYAFCIYQTSTIIIPSTKSFSILWCREQFRDLRPGKLICGFQFRKLPLSACGTTSRRTRGSVSREWSSPRGKEWEGYGGPCDAWRQHRNARWVYKSPGMRACAAVIEWRNLQRNRESACY